MEKIIESKNLIPIVRSRTNDTPDPIIKKEDLEKRIALGKFKDELLRQVLRHASKTRNKGTLISAYVTGQMSINNLNWSDLIDEFPELGEI